VKYRLRVFDNKVLRRIFGPTRDKLTGEWIGLNNEELNDVYCSQKYYSGLQPRRMRLAGHVATMGERRVACRVLVGKSDCRRPRERARSRREDDIETDIQNIERKGMD
jgi:hypothetical protein